VAIPADRNVVQKEAEKKLKYKSLYTTNVEPEMYDYTRNNWSHWNSKEKLTEKFGSCTRKTFDRFTTKDSYTWNITHNAESSAV
jgi:predicted O-methyltransferase YrrM